MGSNRAIAAGQATQYLGIGMGRTNFSITYQTDARDRPLSAIGVRPAAGDPRRGWLTADGWTVPVALGRGGILANKREGDGVKTRRTAITISRSAWSAIRRETG